MPVESDDEFIDIELRTADEVARRCVVLSALLQRVALTSEASASADDDPEAAAFDLREWLRGENLWDTLTTAEASFVSQPVDDALPDAFDTFALGEPLACLAWCLGLDTTLEPHLMPDFAKLTDDMPAPWVATTSWVTSQHLRPELEIATERERAELWEWRLGIEIARRDPSIRQSGDITSTIFDVTFEAQETGLLGPENTRGDYETWQAVSDFEDEALTSMHLLAAHRLRAFNWICGFGIGWDSVPLEI